MTIKIVVERLPTREDMDPVTLRRHPALRQLYSLYEEEGEVAPKIIRENLSVEAARKVLSNRVIELLSAIKENKGASISELARILRRSPSNVYRDLAELARWRIIRLREDGRKKVPEIIAKKIEIEIL